MCKYKFSQDVKIITWKKNVFEVEADSYEEALKKIEPYKERDIAASDDSECVSDVQYFTEKEEMVEVADNGYKATCVLYNDEGYCLGNNVQNCVPDDDFLFNRLVAMLKPEYFHLKDIMKIRKYALQAFSENCATLEKVYPALKEVNVNGNGWTSHLEEAVINTYKLQLHKTTLYQALISKLNWYTILESARKNEESPLEFVIDYIKDVYGISKTEGWDTAMQVLAYFGIKN